MSLKQIFCQDKAISVLRKAFVADRVPHAYIFAGPEGVGKFKAAREWAKLLLCENPVVENNFPDSCGLCSSCLGFEAGSHPDFEVVYKELLEFTRDGKGKTTPLKLPINVVRQFLIEKVRQRPTLAGKRVFIVTEGEKLSTASQNALLKVLEEPPAYCSIILLCTRLESLLPTTRSRCQTIRFGPVAEQRIVDKLGQMGLGGDKALYFARFSQGSLGQACRLASLELAQADFYTTKKQLISCIAAIELKDSLDKAQWLLDESRRLSAIWSKLEEDISKTDIGRKVTKILVRVVISALGDVLRLQLSGEEKIINFEQMGKIKELAKRFGPDRAAEKIIDCYSILYWVDSAVNEKLIFEQVLLNLFVSGRINV